MPTTLVFANPFTLNDRRLPQTNESAHTRLPNSSRVASERPTLAALDDWMDQLSRGDRSNFDRLYRALWPHVVRLCRATLQQRADADDAAQQAMEKIFVRASDYQTGRPVLPWALAIAWWECKTILRKYSRSRQVDVDPAKLSSSTAEDLAAEQREQVRILAQVVESLPLADQRTLIAAFGEATTTVGGATFRKRKERALVRLRAALRRIYG